MQDFYLFEVSLELGSVDSVVGNFLRSKMQLAADSQAGRYMLIGGFSKQLTPLWEESADDDFWRPIVSRLATGPAVVHAGYFRAKEGSDLRVPALLLERVDQAQFDYDALLYKMWRDFRIDSLLSGREYREAAAFGFCAGRVIAQVIESLELAPETVLASFHEWESGVGIFYLRKHLPAVNLNFILHSTALGLVLAENHKTFLSYGKENDAESLAHSYGVYARHCLERQLAKETDSLSTVGSLVAQEANLYLGRFPDRILASGCEREQLDGLDDAERTRQRGLFLRAVGVSEDQLASTMLLVSGGVGHSSDCYNQGYELLLEALVYLKDKLPDRLNHVVLCLAAMEPSPKLSFQDQEDEASYAILQPSKFYNEQEIEQLLAKMQLQESDEVGPDQATKTIKVRIWKPHERYGELGSFSYRRLLNLADLAIFPLQYATWGYSAQESWTLGTPSFTSNLSGFGGWCEERLDHKGHTGLTVLDFKGVSQNSRASVIASRLSAVMQLYAAGDERYQDLREEAKRCAQDMAWSKVYQLFSECYKLTFKLHDLSRLADAIKAEDSREVTALSSELSAVPRLYDACYESMIPEQLKGLRRLANNLWWSWHEAARGLFKRLDPELWGKLHNPIALLNRLSHQKWQQAVHDEELLAIYQKVLADFDSYLNQAPSSSGSRLENADGGKIAYFCMEYGLDNNLPCYSGGLGILSADYLKSMSDLGVDCVAVGLLYRRGYFLQRISSSGEQEEEYPKLNLSELPLNLVRGEDGGHLLTSTEIVGRTIYAQVWQLAVGRVSLYLLDTDVEENLAADREISGNLYVSSVDTRLMQELILGIGGVRFLQEQLKVIPAIYHLNEGHSAFLLLERIRYFTQVQGMSLEEAALLVRSTTQFTTHTPVAAGNEQFSLEIVRSFLASYADSRLKVGMDQLLEWGRDDAAAEQTAFSLTALALRFSMQINTVSEQHNRISKELWHGMWKRWLVSEVPFLNINNGVHLASWLGQEMRALYEKILPGGLEEARQDWESWQVFLQCPLGEIAAAHAKQKQRLLLEVRRRIVGEYLAREENPRLLEQSIAALKDSNCLVIGISRRFAQYKRNNLFMLQVKRLGRLLNDSKRPVLILMAGKAHPADRLGKEMLKEALCKLREAELAGRVIFLQNYDITLAKLMVQGVDLWLNTPVTGREACGTSGMKVAINGGLNLSTRDGWWSEVADRNWGWSIDNYQNDATEERRAKLENSLLLQLLEREIVPAFYGSRADNPEDPWLLRVRESLTGVSYHYSSVRMAMAYLASYNQLIRYHHKLMMGGSEEGYNLRALVNWQRELAGRFNRVNVKAVMVKGIKDGQVLAGGRLQVKVLLYPGKMTAGELQVELVLLAEKEKWEPIFVALHRVESKGQDEELQTYIAEYELQDSGFYRYGIRILPTMPLLFRRQEAQLAHWS